MKIEVEMTHKQRIKNKMADSDCGLRHHLFIKFADSKMCIVFVCMRYVKKIGCHYNQSGVLYARNLCIIQSGVLKIEILILLRLARFQNLETPHKSILCKVPLLARALGLYSR